MRISAINNSYSFTSTEQPSKKNQNPISKTGEKAILTKAAFIGGLGIGARCLLELADGDFLGEIFRKNAETIVNKQYKNISANKKIMLTIGVFCGLVAAFVSGFALLYTLFKAPNINYQGNVNAFKKGKDMDVYIKGNSAEKEIYTQMNEKAQNASPEEKAKLKEQYMLMKKAKNRVPDFVNTGLTNNKKS